MKVADSLDRHKNSDNLEFRQDRTIHFVGTCAWVTKTSLFDFVWRIACLIFIQSL